MMLGRKQSMDNSRWLAAVANIESLISHQELKTLIEKTVSEIQEKTAGKNAAFAWSAGKDSIVLANICQSVGIGASVIGMCALEYPVFMDWVSQHLPENCTIINTGQDIAWLSKHQEMLFPQDSKTAAKWFSIVQHKAQMQYFHDNDLDILLLGRRRADGNYVGSKDGIYTDKKGVTRYSPLHQWRHEDILAYIHYYCLDLPPIYNWHNGYLCGTHPWPARQWTGSIENGWREVDQIDPAIVEKAAEHINSAREYLGGRKV